MSTLPNEDSIREQAYYLWEQDGRPDGRASEYWSRAAASLSVAPSSKGARSPKTSSGKKMVKPALKRKKAR